MKRIVLSSLAVCAVAILVAIGVFGHFIASQASPDGLLRELTFDLKVRDQDECLRDGVSETWGAADMAPGQAFDFNRPGYFVELQRLGLLPADHLEMGCSYIGSAAPDALARQMVFTDLRYSSSYWAIDLLDGTGGPACKPCAYQPGDWRVRDADGDGKLTFYDLKTLPLDNIPPPCFGDNWATHVEMSVKFSEGAGNEFEGESLQMSLSFTLNECSGE